MAIVLKEVSCAIFVVWKVSSRFFSRIRVLNGFSQFLQTYNSDQSAKSGHIRTSHPSKKIEKDLFFFNSYTEQAELTVDLLKAALLYQLEGGRVNPRIIF